MQVIGGDLYDGGNWLGVLLSVLVGCIPVVGQLCDARDVLANIGKLIDDGPQESEWIALFFSGIALFLDRSFLETCRRRRRCSRGIQTLGMNY